MSEVNGLIEAPAWQEYRVSLAGVIASALANHGGILAVVRDLARHADEAEPREARDRWLELDFRPDSLVARHGSPLGAGDLDSLRELGSSEAPLRNGASHAFGAGLASLYRLTDEPVIVSGDTMLRLVPAESRVYQSKVPATDHTRIELALRRQETDFSRAIGEGPVGEAELRAALEGLRLEAYRLLLFTRRLARITVLREGRPVVTVSKRRLDVTERDGGREERWEFQHEAEPAGGARAARGPVTHEWRLLVATASGDRALEGPPGGKSPEVALAVCRSSDRSGYPPLVEQLLAAGGGRLYASLPTAVATQRGLSANADFFWSHAGDALETGQSRHRAWNEALLRAIGRLFVASLPRLQELAGDNLAWFYSLLPGAMPAPDGSPESAAMRVVDGEIERHLGSLSLLKVASGRWVTVSEARLPEPALAELVGDQVGNLVRNLPAGPAAWLKEHGLRSWGFDDLLKLIQAEVKVGTPVAEAHPVVNSLQKIERLYRALDAQHIQPLSSAPIVLSDDDKLYPLADSRNQVHLVPEALRKVLRESDAKLVKTELQNRFEKQLERWGVPKLEVTDYLKAIAGQCRNKSLGDESLPAVVRTRDRLEELFAYLAKENVDLRKKQAAIFPDQGGVLRQATEVTLAETVERRFVGDDVRCLAGELAGGKFKSYIEQYTDVPQLTTKRLLEVLQRRFQAEQPLANHPDGIGRGHLVELFTRLSREIHDDATMAALRRTYIFPTTEGMLVAPGSAYRGERGEVHKDLEPFLTGLRLLDPEVMQGRLATFFDRLGVRPLSPEALVGELLRADLSHASPGQRKRIAGLAARHLERLLADLNLRQSLARARLFRCDDGEYRSLDEVYEESVASVLEVPLLDAREYPPTSRASEGLTWAQFFRATADAGIGPHGTLRPRDVATFIQGLPEAPTAQAVADVQRVLAHLAERWSAYQPQSGDRDLRLLNSRAWLPAVGDRKRWFKGSELFVAGLRYLPLGAGAAFLDFTGNLPADMARFLGVTVEPAPNLVVRGLLDLAAIGEAPEDAQRLYAFLGEHLKDAALQRLKGKPVVWDAHTRRYWAADRTYLNGPREFGSHRAALRADGPALAFLVWLGAHEGQPTTRQRLDFLGDVAEDAEGQPLSEENRELVLQQYERLLETDEPLPTPRRPIVLLENGTMALPSNCYINDDPDRRRYFDDLPYVDPRAVPFAARLGVRRLSQADETPSFDVRTTEVDDTWTARLRDYAEPITRCLLHLVRRLGTPESDWEALRRIEVVRLPRLIVRYAFKGGPESRDRELPAMFSPEEARLYMRDEGTEGARTHAIAWALARTLAPEGAGESDKELLAERIEAALDQPGPLQAMQLLDQKDVARLEEPEPAQPAGATGEEDEDGAALGHLPLPEEAASIPEFEEPILVTALRGDRKQMGRWGHELQRMFGAAAMRLLEDSAQRLNPAVALSSHERRPRGPRGEVPTEASVLLLQRHLEGSLPLQGEVRQMLSDLEVGAIPCQMWQGEKVWLIVDWERGLLYNQDALRDWYGARELRVGTRLTLHRREGPELFLMPTLQETVLKGVDEVALVDGRPELRSVERKVRYALDETVYRAGVWLENFENLVALAEQRGQGGVEQYLLRIFRDAEIEGVERRTPSGNALLTASEVVRALRPRLRLSTGTVLATLARYSCFELQGTTYWLNSSRLDAGRPVERGDPRGEPKPERQAQTPAPVTVGAARAAGGPVAVTPAAGPIVGAGVLEPTLQQFQAQMREVTPWIEMGARRSKDFQKVSKLFNDLAVFFDNLRREPPAAAVASAPNGSATAPAAPAPGATAAAPAVPSGQPADETPAWVRELLDALAGPGPTPELLRMAEQGLRNLKVAPVRRADLARLAHALYERAGSDYEEERPALVPQLAALAVAAWRSISDPAQREALFADVAAPALDLLQRVEEGEPVVEAMAAAYMLEQLDIYGNAIDDAYERLGFGREACIRLGDAYIALRLWEPAKAALEEAKSLAPPDQEDAIDVKLTNLSLASALSASPPDTRRLAERARRSNVAIAVDPNWLDSFLARGLVAKQS